MRQTSLATLGLVLAVGVGCDDGCSPEPSFAWKGERVTVYGFGHSESDACAGSFGALEDRIGMVEEFLGVGEGRRYEYWWMSDRDWQEIEPCPIEAAACTTQEGVAVSRQLPDMHEAVHMVARSIGGDGCPFVLNEGIAEYLTDPRLSDWAPSEEQPLAELLNTENFPFTR